MLVHHQRLPIQLIFTGVHAHSPRLQPFVRHSRRSAKFLCCSTRAINTGPHRYAVIGGGFAGVATAYHLAASASVSQAVEVHLYDLAGLGAGGSGAAGGLLHPFSPKGKLLWKGQEAFEAALELISAAESSQQSLAQQTPDASHQFVWRQNLLRPAADVKQAEGFQTLQASSLGELASAEAITSQQAHALMPGLNPAALPQSFQDEGEAHAAALLIKGGLVLHPTKYLRNLWQCCVSMLAGLGNGSQACLKLHQVHSLAELEQQQGPYDAVVVAAGAAAATLPEVGDVLPVRLSQGYGLELVPPSPATNSNQQAVIAQDKTQSQDRQFTAISNQQAITAQDKSSLEAGQHGARQQSFRQATVAQDKPLSEAGQDTARQQPHKQAMTAHYEPPFEVKESTATQQPLTQAVTAKANPSAEDDQHSARQQSLTQAVPSSAEDGASSAISAPSAEAEPSGQEHAAGQQVRVPDHTAGYAPGWPSLVGATYMGVQGGSLISVGATKQLGLTPHQALLECGRQVTDAREIQLAEKLLRPRAEGLWLPAAAWQVAQVRTGVRALPTRTIEGGIPLAGQLPSSPKDKSWWIVGGLGARGLVYHAWLGKLVAQAIFQGDDALLPSQLVRWKA